MNEIFKTIKIKIFIFYYFMLQFNAIYFHHKMFLDPRFKPYFQKYFYHQKKANIKQLDFYLF